MSRWNLFPPPLEIESPKKKTPPGGGGYDKWVTRLICPYSIQIRSGDKTTSIESCMCDKTHSRVARPINVWHDKFMCDTNRWRMSWLSPLRHDSFMSVYMRHGSFICDMTHSRMTWPIQVYSFAYDIDPYDQWGLRSMCHTTNLSLLDSNKKWWQNNQHWIMYVWQDSFTRGTTH